VRSASTAVAGLYNISATARNSAQSTLAGTANMTYLIETSTVNAAPQAIDDNAATAMNTAVTVSVLANDRDPEGQTLRVTGVTQGMKGQVTINSNGTVTYRPNAKVSGQTDTFRYTVTDGTSSASATVSVAIDRRRK
jgi:VCBS repeat-containing protein